jgi:hypothetical protein
MRAWLEVGSTPNDICLSRRASSHLDYINLFDLGRLFPHAEAPKPFASHGQTKLTDTPLLPFLMATTVENDLEAEKSGSAATEDLQSAVSSVQSQIDLLADLNKRLQTLRQLPGGVLRSELVLGTNQVLQTLTLKDIFGKSAEDLRTLHAAALEGKVQDALRAAAESERRDGTAIKDARERESQKRRCVSTPIHAFAWPFFYLCSLHTRY